MPALSVYPERDSPKDLIGTTFFESYYKSILGFSENTLLILPNDELRPTVTYKSFHQDVINLTNFILEKPSKSDVVVTTRWAPWNRRPAYAWSKKLIWTLWVGMFLSAGISKIRHSGLHWVTSDGLRTQFIFNQY